MGRHRAIYTVFLSIACTVSHPVEVEHTLLLCPEDCLAKSSDPDPLLVSDYNILVFNSFGALEEKVYVPERELSPQVKHRITLLKDVPYTILAAANTGYELPRMSLQEAMQYTFHLAYPDEYTHGIPMSGVLEGCFSDGTITLPLKKLMAKLELSVDRSLLYPDVELEIREVSIGDCPSSITIFGENDRADTFAQGFTRSGRETDPLNAGSSISIYMLETASKAPYIELKARYESESWISRPGEYLIYRFYPRQVFRNALQQISVCPKGDGLGGGDWELDKSALEPIRRMDLYPASYNTCRVDESFHLWCNLRPRGTPMEIEALAYDEEDCAVSDIYDYTLDADGCGLTIKPKKSGSAVIYFKAGPPVLRDTLAMLVIQEP